jgi:hypothetical protein
VLKQRSPNSPYKNLKATMVPLHKDVPRGQLNAYLDENFIMRIGVPHSGGSLAAHALESQWPVMVSAAAFWDRDKQKFRVPTATSLEDCDFALDSAGFTAVAGWGRKGRQRGIAGVYPWTVSEFVSFATAMNPRWWAQPDLCCEPEIAPNREVVKYRIEATASILEAVLRQVYNLQNEAARSQFSPLVSNAFPSPVPVIQGRTVDDYRYSLELLRGVWDTWSGWLSEPALIGVGSMCRRHLDHPTEGVFAILEGIKDYLPPGSKLHVYGVKGPALTRLAKMGYIASADSMAWDVSTRMSAVKAGVPNTMERRKAGMTEWMESAISRIPARLDHHHDLLLAA